MTHSTEAKASDIDPDIRFFVDKINAEALALSGGKPVSMARRREIAEKVRAPWTAGGPQMAFSETLRIGDEGLRVRVHVPPSGAGGGTLVYLHGGGWALFSVDTHDRLMREYAARAGCGVIGLDYSLAPEHPFPAALDDIEACLAWLMEEGKGMGLNTARIALGGDSAGGNLSLTTALRRRDRGEPGLAGLLLNYAALDTTERASHARYDGEPYMLSVEEMKAFWLDYLGAPTTDDPYARPLLADLRGLPPVHLCIAECDILLDENLELKSRLEAVNVPVSAEIYPGATHSFLEAVSVSPLAGRAIADASSWLARVLGG